MSLDRFANLIGNPSSLNYGPQNRTNYVTEFTTVTPLVLSTIKPMLVGASGTDFEDTLYPRVGRCAVVEPVVDAAKRPDGASEYQAYFTTGIVRGPSKRPYDTSGANSKYDIVSVVNMTPYEYFECSHLTVGRTEGDWHILGAVNPVFRAEVTETITDTTLGAVKLGYVPFKNMQSGDTLPDIRWMEELDADDEKTDVVRPCANFLGGGDISVGTKCLVEQEAGGLWTVVAVEC